MEKRIKKDNTAVFRERFQKWERYLLARYGRGRPASLNRLISRFWQAENDRCLELNITADDLWNLKRIRNVLAHDQAMIAVRDKAAVIVGKLVGAFCLSAKDIATPAGRIYTVGPETSVADAIKCMADRDFTHVPVVDGREFIGLFSEKVALRLMADGRDPARLKMAAISEYFAADDKEPFEFLPAAADYFAVYSLFREYIDRGRKLGVIFLTANGRSSGHILGLITAWDLNRA